MSDDRKLESLKSLQLEIKSKLNLLATKKAYEDEKNRHIQELSFAEKELDNLIAERNRAEEELKIKSAEYEKIKIEVVEIQKRFEVISGQRDYDALTKLNADAQASESTALVSKKAKETELNELKKLVEIKTAELEDKRAVVDEPAKEIDEKCQEITQQIAEIDSRIASIKEGVIDDELYYRFLNIAEKKGGDGFVPVHGQVCTGCNMVLPMQFVIDLRLKQFNGEIDTCPYCSRMIYYDKLSDDEEKRYFFDNFEAIKNTSKTGDASEDSEIDEDNVTSEDPEGVVDIDSDF